MKKVLFLLFAAAVTLTSCTKLSHGSDDLFPNIGRTEDNPNSGGGRNTTNVPAAVTAAFTARYPDATSVQWKTDSNGNYKVEFYRAGVKWQAIFTAAGKLVKEEHK